MSEVHRSRMLLIDDNPDVREVLARLLVSFGYDCQTAADAMCGLARFDEGGWDLVVLDIVMPARSGWEVVEMIRRRAPLIQIVLITGLSQPAVMQRARDLRLPIVTKPFRADALRAVLVTALQTRVS